MLPPVARHTNRKYEEQYCDRLRGGVAAEARAHCAMANALQPRVARLGFALLGPLFLGALFYGQGSGAVSNTVELAGSKYKDDSGYAAYVETTPLVVPTLKSIAAALPKSLPWDQ